MADSYKDLIVWQRAMDLVVAVYQLTKSFPADERYGLVSQMNRAAVSIVSNIAEGRHRGSRKDFRQFLIVAYASAAELETQIEVSKRLSFSAEEAYTQVDSLLNEVLRMLNTMVGTLKANS